MAHTGSVHTEGAPAQRLQCTSKGPILDHNIVIVWLIYKQMKVWLIYRPYTLPGRYDQAWLM